MFTKEYISFLKSIIERLEKNEKLEITNRDMDIIPFGQYPHIHSIFHRIEDKLDEVNNCCQKGSNAITKLIINNGKYEIGYSTLHEWLKDAKELIICDPYYFTWRKTAVFGTETKYSEEIIKILPNRIKSLTIYHLPGAKKTIIDKVKKDCNKRNRYFRSITTNEIHDRVWIKNMNNGVCIGTSFGGLGNKVSFILTLPKSDLDNFKRKLFEIKQTK